MPRSDRKKRPTAAMRAVVKAIIAMKGRASRSVKIAADMTGPAADTWRRLYQASKGLNFDDSRLIALLMICGAIAAEKALLDMPREG